MQAKDLTIGYIGGGSKDWAWKLMNDLALEPALGGRVFLYDTNKEAARENAALAKRIFAHKDCQSKWDFHVKEDLESCLAGADMVIVSILPGSFEEMRGDVHSPEEYGIYQSVGDTVGPGGMMRSLRCVPMYEVIGAAVKEYCPKAWVINYTNPMSVCTRALYRVFPEIKAFGCCHEVFSTQEILQAVVAEYLGESPSRHEIDIEVMGINHFTWLTRAAYRGIDLAPYYDQFITKYLETGYGGKNPETKNNNPFSSVELVKFDLFREYGYYAAAGDRHLAEFTSAKYLINPEAVAKWKFGLTTVEYRLQQREERKARNHSLAYGGEPLSIKPSGEEGVSIIKALAGVAPIVTNMNLPNQGQITNLPLGAIVETNAYICGDRVYPVFVGAMPKPLLDMTLPYLLGQNAIVEAALAKDRAAAFHCFLNDPMVRRLSYEAASELFDKMEAIQKPYMPWEIK